LRYVVYCIVEIVRLNYRIIILCSFYCYEYDDSH